MLSNQDYDELMRPIIEMYNDMETELLMEVARRFATYDSVGGSLEWYVRKLDELGELNQSAIKVIAKYSGRSEKKIKEMLQNAGYMSVPLDDYNKVYRSGGILVDPTTISISNIIDNSYVESKDVYKLIQTKAIQGTKQAYMNVLNQAYLEVGGGIYDYNTSIKRACESMAKQGITCATYKDKKGNVRKMSIEAVIRRDTLTAINKVANASNDRFIEEMGATHVEVSWHLGARNTGTGWQNHEAWQGKVYLIEGSNEEYKNFYQTTGYGEVDGLGGVNCRHNHRAFFPGFSIQMEPPSDYDHEYYELTQKQRYFERGIRRWKKELAVYEGLGDEANIERCQKKVKEWQNNLQSFIDEHEQLKRDYSRERIYTPRSSQISYFEERETQELNNGFEEYIPNDLEFSQEKEENLNDSYIQIDKAYMKDGYEYLTINDSKTGEQITPLITSHEVNHVEPPQDVIDFMEQAPKDSLVSIHNHPSKGTFSIEDIITHLTTTSFKESIVINNDGEIFLFSTSKGVNLKIRTQKDRDIFTDYVKSVRSEIAHDKELSKKEINHYTWMRISNDMGWSYGYRKKS